jgi:hypothetical protein
MRLLVSCLLAGAIASAPVAAQTESSAAASPTQPAVIAAPAADGYTIAALTPVQIEILARMNSQLSKIGEHFPIRLAAPIDLGGGHQLPAGATGSGDVVHAAKSRFGGKPGEMILAARYIEYGGVRIPLRSLSFPTTRGRGRDNTETAAAVTIAIGLPGLFITGGEVDVPAGTIAYAKTSAPVIIPAAALAPIPTPSPSEEGSLKP